MVRIAIIGGGFAGTFAARELRKHLRKECSIILFEPRARFVFTPLLHEVAGGVLDEHAVTLSYKELFGNRVQHTRHKVRRIDLPKRQVIADKAYPFDYIIIAPGATSRTSGTLRDFDDAMRIRSTIERQVKRGNTDCVVIGGGPTGVEVAGEVHDLIAFRLGREGMHGTPQVTLLQSRDELLPQFPPWMREAARHKLTAKGIAVVTGVRVQKAERGALHLTVNGKRRILKCSSAIWTIGIRPAAVAGLKTPVQVTATLQVKGCPYAFAAGDASAMDLPVPQLAQVASKQGEHAAKNIVRMIKGRRLQEFRFHDRGRLVSIGQKWAVGDVMGMAIKGFPAWFIMRTVYLFKFHNVRQEFRTAYEYTVRLFRREE